VVIVFSEHDAGQQVGVVPEAVALRLEFAPAQTVRAFSLAGVDEEAAPTCCYECPRRSSLRRLLPRRLMLPLAPVLPPAVCHAFALFAGSGRRTGITRACAALLPEGYEYFMQRSRLPRRVIDALVLPRGRQRECGIAER